MATAPNSGLLLASRTAAAILGGYAFTWGTIVFGAALLVAAGMDFHDAEHLTYIVGFLVFLTAFLMAYVARSLKRIWLVLFGGGALMTIGASLVQSQLV